MRKNLVVDAKELTDQIYDTLSGNVGMSEYHVMLDPMSIIMGECLNTQGEIRFKINGRYYLIQVSEIPCPEYWLDEQD